MSSYRLQAALLAVVLVLSQAPGRARAAGGPPARDPRDRDRLGWAVPDFVRLQTGGFSGLVTLGLGYALLDDLVNVTGLYGYAPIDGGRDVHSVHLTVSSRPGEVRIQRLAWLPLYFGFGALGTWGPGYFVTPPARYPRGYYHSTAVRASAHVGTELDWLPRRNAFERHGAYFELTTLDLLIYERFKNPRVVRITDVVSSTLGYRVAF